ncbi:MAG: hypothetical protein KDK56_07910, partial [Simkania sp.]|nr:hypothetical protein [Simkania sp.]
MKRFFKILLICLCLFCVGAKSPPKKKVCFIVNPISGTGKNKKIKPLIKKYLDRKQFEYKIFYTDRPKHATEL